MLSAMVQRAFRFTAAPRVHSEHGQTGIEPYEVPAWTEARTTPDRYLELALLPRPLVKQGTIEQQTADSKHSRGDQNGATEERWHFLQLFQNEAGNVIIRGRRTVPCHRVMGGGDGITECGNGIR